MSRSALNAGRAKQIAEPRPDRCGSIAVLRMLANWRAVPSAALSAILPAKPSVTTTSTVPLPMSSPSTKPTYSKLRPAFLAQDAAGLAYLFQPLGLLDADIEQAHGRPIEVEQHARHRAAHGGEIDEVRASAPIEAPRSSTIDAPRSVGHSAAIAGRSIPGIVLRLNFAIAISAPVLPADTATSASPFFTASMASHIDDFQRPLRSAWLGLSSIWTTTSLWTSREAACSRGRAASSGATTRLVAKQEKLDVGVPGQRQLGAWNDHAAPVVTPHGVERDADFSGHEFDIYRLGGSRQQGANTSACLPAPAPSSARRAPRTDAPRIAGRGAGTPPPACGDRDRSPEAEIRWRSRRDRSFRRSGVPARRRSPSSGPGSPALSGRASTGTKTRSTGSSISFSIGSSVTTQTCPTVARTRPETRRPPFPCSVTSKSASRRGRSRSPASFAVASRTGASATRSSWRPVSGTSLTASGKLQGNSDTVLDISKRPEGAPFFVAPIWAWEPDGAMRSVRLPAMSPRAPDRESEPPTGEFLVTLRGKRRRLTGHSGPAAPHRPAGGGAPPNTFSARRPPGTRDRPPASAC